MNGLRSTHGSPGPTMSWTVDGLTLENGGTSSARHVTVTVTTPEDDLTYESKVAELVPGDRRRLHPALDLDRVPELRVRLRWWDGGLRTRSSEGTVRLPPSDRDRAAHQVRATS